MAFSLNDQLAWARRNLSFARTNRLPASMITRLAERVVYLEWLATQEPLVLSGQSRWWEDVKDAVLAKALPALLSG